MEKTLEQEFAEYKEHHMYEMSVSGLIVFGDKGLYDHKLLKDYKDLDLTGDEKAYYIIDDLYDRASKGEKELYEKVYEMCWKKMRNEINNNKSYRIGINYEE